MDASRDSINQDDYMDNDVIVTNHASNYPSSYRDAKIILEKWLVEEGDFVRVDQTIFELSMDNGILPSLSATGKSPINGIILSRIHAGTILEENHNCCVIRPISDSQLPTYIYQFGVAESGRGESGEGVIHVDFEEVSSNEHKAHARVNVINDDFDGGSTIETNTERMSSFTGSVDLYFSFLQRKPKNYLSLKGYRKHFRFKQGSRIQLLFLDGSKHALELEQDGQRFDKDSDGVIFKNEIGMNDELLEKFCESPLLKWKMEYKPEGIEIIGGKVFDYFGEDFVRRALMLKARAFKQITTEK